MKNKVVQWLNKSRLIDGAMVKDNGHWAVSVQAAILKGGITSIEYDHRCVWTVEDGWIDSFFVITMAEAERVAHVSFFDAGQIYAPYMPIMGTTREP